MHPEYVEQIIQLMVEGEHQEEGARQIATFEEVVRLADAHNDIDLGFRVRRRLMAAAMCGGQPDLLMVSFSWCLAQCDRDPHRFPIEELLWAYRWVIFELTSFPQVPRSQFDELLREMERRYLAAGSTLRGYWLLRNRMETKMGNLRAAGAAYEKFLTCARDHLSDSAEVEQAFKALYLLPLGDDVQTLEACAPILRNVYKSELYQGIAHAIVLAPLLRLGRVADAVSCHLRGYRLVSRNPRYVDRVGDHITLLALTDNLARGFGLMARHLPEALATVDRSAAFEFYLGCRMLLDVVRYEGRSRVKMRLTDRFPLFRPDGEYAVGDLLAWFESQMDDLAAKFDARNGNDFLRRQIDGHNQLRQHARRYPLPSRAAD